MNERDLTVGPSLLVPGAQYQTVPVSRLHNECLAYSRSAAIHHPPGITRLLIAQTNCSNITCKRQASF